MIDLLTIRDCLRNIAGQCTTPTGTAGQLLDLADEIDRALQAPTPDWHDREAEAAQTTTEDR